LTHHPELKTNHESIYLWIYEERKDLVSYFDLIEKYGVDGFEKRLEKVKNKIEDMRAKK